MVRTEELARSVLRKYASNLPVAVVLARTAPSTAQIGGGVLFSCRTFTVDAERIERLKKHLGDALVALPRPLSSFVAVAALAWTSLARCRPDKAAFFFFADARAVAWTLPPTPGRRGILQHVPHRLPMSAKPKKIQLIRRRTRAKNLLVKALGRTSRSAKHFSVKSLRLNRSARCSKRFGRNQGFVYRY